MLAKANGVQFSDKDVVNVDDFIPKGEYNPHNVRPWLLHDHGFVLGVVFADCLQDALNELADSGKIDSFLVEEKDLAQYGPEEEGITRLGNAGEPFDVEGIDFVELINPPFSFVALFNAAQKGS